MEGGSPYGNRLTHHGLPAEFIDCGMKSHSGRNTADCPKPKRHETQFPFSAEFLQKALFFQLCFSIRTLRLEFIGGAKFIHHLVLCAIHACWREMDKRQVEFRTCFSYYVLSELPSGLSFQFYNKGLIRKTGENQESPSMQDMIDVANRYKSRAEFYKQRLIKYLKQNNALYPNYLNFGSGIDSIKPDNEGYTVSMWLGDNGCCGDGWNRC